MEEIDLQLRYGLAPLLARLLKLLYDRDLVRDGDIDAPMRQTVLRLRTALAAAALETDTVPPIVHSRRTIGYWLDAATKQAMLEAASKGQQSLPLGDRR